MYYYHNYTSAMSRLAIIDYERCQPNKCNKECMRYCPSNQQKQECITLVDIEDLGKKAKVSAVFCIGCGICTKKCPFGAVYIVNLPKQLTPDYTLHSYGENSFRVYSKPSIKKGSCTGLLGANGLGKSTILKVLSGELKLDLTNKSTKKLVSGSELFKYLTDLNAGNIKVSYKPQDVLMGSRLKRPVKGILKTIKKDLIEKFQLDKLRDRCLKDLSGGEMQRLMIAKVCSVDADSYLFDEPAAFLDIKQRLKASSAIIGMTDCTSESTSNEKYVMCIEHDLCVLDYICDNVTCLYGEPSCYGVVTSVYGTFHGINNYLDGHFKKENIRFRDQPIKFNLSNISDDVAESYVSYPYGNCTISYGSSFKLNIEEGVFGKKQVVLLVGENGTGKSSFINMVAGKTKAHGEQFPELSISHKEQNPYINDFDGTVQELLNYKIPKSMCDSAFVSTVLTPLKIPSQYEINVSSLSGGQMQKLSIAICLGTVADVYLLDEPSAYIDVDDRLHVAKIIKYYANFYNKTVFLVEHDIIMATSISDSVIVFDGEPGVECTAKSPQDLSTGINEFLKSINVTMRKDKYSMRPRINKMNSNKDREQKSSGNHYLIE